MQILQKSAKWSKDFIQNRTYVKNSQIQRKNTPFTRNKNIHPQHNHAANAFLCSHLNCLFIKF